MRLKDRVAIVTGGGGGIGRAICLCLAREGAHVIVSDLNLPSAENVAAEISNTGQKAFAVQTDVCSEKAVQSLVDFSLKQMGKIDILVCCSGIPGYTDKTPINEGTTRIENISVEDWDLTIDTNLKGVFLCNRAVAPYFKERKNGKIVNISSVAGRRGSDWIPHYSASKAGRNCFQPGCSRSIGAIQCERQYDLSRPDLDVHVHSCGKNDVQFVSAVQGHEPHRSLRWVGQGKGASREAPGSGVNWQCGCFSGLGRSKGHHGPGIECRRRHDIQLKRFASQAMPGRRRRAINDHRNTPRGIHRQ